jgi:ATP:ADP antiporter, AAA family
MLAGIRAGEGIGVSLFFAYAFLLVFTYYLLKTLREPLLLADGSAALKSYAYAVIALVLLPLVPLYSIAFRRLRRDVLTRAITLFFLVSLAMLYFAARSGIDIGFVYYVWVGVFGATMIAQFWSHAADSFNLHDGQRLFPAIMVGAALGGLVGPPVASALYNALDPWPLMAAAGLLLAATLPLIGSSRRRIRAACGAPMKVATPPTCRLGGLSLVIRDRYLLLLAILVVLLSCVSTTGEYMLAEWVSAYADEQAARDTMLKRGDVIAGFYAGFFFAVNALTLTIQILLVPRLIRWIGVRGALLVLPVIAVIGYGILFVVPVFSALRLLKLFENSVDYSVMNTCRHSLYLPLSTSAKYEGKITIDAFFWRFGDIIQAAIVFAGLNWLGFELPHFALLNTLLALAGLAVAIELGKRYRRHAPQAKATRAVAPSVTLLGLARRGFSGVAARRALTAAGACGFSVVAGLAPGVM